MRKPLKGKDFMIFVNSKAIALATSHSLRLNAETSDTSSKDSGVWSEAEITGMSWEASSESIGSPAGDEALDLSYEELFDLMLAGSTVDIISGIPKNQSLDGVPSDGWKAPDGQDKSQAYYTGKALITSVEMTGANGDNSSISATFTGVGKLEKKAKASAASVLKTEPKSEIQK